MNYYNEIKNEIIDIETYKKVKDYSKNKRELEGYYKIGKLLIEAQGGELRAKYGNGLIKEYTIKLANELNIKYSERSLRNMRQFYLTFKDEIWQPLVSNLNWSQCTILLPLKDKNKIKYYIYQCKINNLSKRQLQEKIKNQEYERIPEETKIKIISNEENKIEDFIKHPIIIKSNINYDNISEKVLQDLILEDIPSFLKELGEGYSFIENEYKIKVEDTFNYIDILLFNIKYNCYCVLELKTTKLKKEHIGQIQTYMDYIDSEVKSIYHNKTIGIIICRENNSYVIKYCSNPNIYQTTYLTVNEEVIEYA